MVQDLVVSSSASVHVRPPVTCVLVTLRTHYPHGHGCKLGDGEQGDPDIGCSERQPCRRREALLWVSKSYMRQSPRTATPTEDTEDGNLGERREGRQARGRGEAAGRLEQVTGRDRAPGMLFPSLHSADTKGNLETPKQSPSPLSPSPALS